MTAGGEGEACGEVAEEAVDALVHAADALEAGNGFLADIAAFIEIDGGVFEAGFLRQGVFGDFEAPCGLTVDDTEKGELRRRGGGEVGGFFSCVETGQACAVDAEGFSGRLDAEDVVQRR
jgi:hypothetical protein